MKKLTLSVMAAFLMFAIIPAQLSAVTNTTPSSITATRPSDPETEELALALTTRLDEIKNMDKAGLSPAEKSELRKEVRAIKSELRDIGRGVYLSVGAVIVIVLLLILLL
jgi:hypothetical protein